MEEEKRSEANDKKREKTKEKSEWNVGLMKRKGTKDENVKRKGRRKEMGKKTKE